MADWYEDVMSLAISARGGTGLSLAALQRGRND